MNVGKTIAECRKKKNMTQSEVADQLGVSYQAVSKWERDESLPDITLLPQIADLFHISIDELVRGEFEKTKVKQEVSEQDYFDDKIDALTEDVTNLVNQAFEEGLPNDEELTDKITTYFTQHFSQKFQNLAPFMKPKEIKKRVLDADANFNDISEQTYEYLDQDTIAILLNSIDELNDEVCDKLEELIPYCNSFNREKIVELMCNSDFEDYNLEDFIIFFNSFQKRQILNHYFEDLTEEKMEQFEDILPLCNEECRNFIVEKIIEWDDFDFELDDVMPFLNSEQKERLVNWMVTHEELYEGLEDIFPFLNKEQKKTCMNWAKDKMDFDELSDLLYL